MRSGLNAIPAFILDKFPEFAARLDGGGPIGVAVSGGGDSVAMLYALAEWKQRPLEVFCVDHGLNALSPQWTRSVAAHVARLGAGFTALHWQGEKPSTGLSAAARLARHRLLAEAARRKGVSVICLAHTADDIAEAEAMRGQGSTVGAPKIWAPSPVWPEGHDIFLYRPFLDVRREALRDYLRGMVVSWIEDPANESPKSLRARTRKALRDQAIAPRLPGAEALITPMQMRGLLYGRDLLSPLGMIAFKADVFDALPQDIALKLLSSAAVCAGGGDRLPRHDKVLGLLDNLPAGKALTLAGARICRQDGVISFSRETGDIGRNRTGELVMTGAGEGIWDGRYDIRSAQAGKIVASARVRGALSEGDKAWLLSLPAAVRGSQAVFIAAEQKDNQNKCLLTNPGLGHNADNGPQAQCLAEPRLWAALGLITTESAIKRAKK